MAKASKPTTTEAPRSYTLICRHTDKHGTNVSAYTFMASELAEDFTPSQIAELNAGLIVVRDMPRWGAKVEWMEIGAAAQKLFGKAR